MLRPKLPDYDLAAWRARPFRDRLRMVCVAWAAQGYGSPAGVYLLYLAKIGLYVLGWALCCTATPGWTLGNVAEWWASDLAFQKAVAWTLLFEGLGLGCGSGPLTGRYLPPLGGPLYFLRPGTTKLPLFGPAFGHRRTVLDAAAYGLTIALLVRLLAAPAIGPGHLWPVLVAVPLLGVLDKTLFLVFRSEHHLSVLLCFLFPDWLPGAKLVWLAVWWWAATSKVNRHFPAVMCVMASNSPFSPPAFKRAMYRSFPDDLRPSRFAEVLAHGGTALEALFPAVLALSPGGPVSAAALVTMTVFHLFILAQVPMGVPLEWNVLMIYGGWVLFGVHADIPAWSVHTPALWAWLAAFHVALPVYGSLCPDRVSFLLAMRYYAGNWATSAWLFAPGASRKLDAGLVKASAGVREQLGLLYDADTIDALLSKVLAFRAMHLHGRALLGVASRSVPDLPAREWLDGELVAGMVVGWNFGEGHLHGPELLGAIQAQCGFAPGELRVVTLESQPIHRAVHAWAVWDAHDGLVERGDVAVADFAEQAPWEAVPG